MVPQLDTFNFEYILNIFSRL